LSGGGHGAGRGEKNGDKKKKEKGGMAAEVTNLEGHYKISICGGVTYMGDRQSETTRYFNYMKRKGRGSTGRILCQNFQFT